MLTKLLHLAHRYPRRILWLLSFAAVALVATAIVLTEWLRLNPCHLCIFQRLQQLFIAVCFGLGGWFVGRPAGRLWVSTGGLIALSGMAVAGFQSWGQWFPEIVGSCTGAEPNLIERLVEWLGVRWPTLFMATGFCESKELVIFGLSLANWSFVAFTGFAIAAFVFSIFVWKGKAS